MRHEITYLQRGSMAVPLVIPDQSGLIEERPKTRRNPKGKKARKAAARLAAAREAQAPEAVLPEASPKPHRAKGRTTTRAIGTGEGKGKAKANAVGKAERRACSSAERRACSSAERRKAVQPQQLPAIPALPLLEQRLAAQRAPAVALPIRPEPLALAARPAPVSPICPLPEAAQLSPAAPVIALLPAPQPRAEERVVPAGPEVEPARAAQPAMVSAPADLAPLPRAVALVPARRQGLVDVIAFLLRDSGRRLARWSARRHQSREEQAMLRRAEARQINLQRELAALDALQPNRG